MRRREGKRGSEQWREEVKAPLVALLGDDDNNVPAQIGSGTSREGCREGGGRKTH